MYRIAYSGGRGPTGPALLVACALAVACGCRWTPLRADLDIAQSLERGGHDEEALAAWHKIVAACPPRATPTPDRAASSTREHPTFHDSRVRDDCGLAAFREAQTLERLGRYREAEAAFEAVPLRAVDPRHAARALVRAAEISAEKIEDRPQAIQLAYRDMEAYPDEVPADDALALLVRLERKRDPRTLRDALDELSKKLGPTDLADNLVLAAGELCARELDDHAGAIARFDALSRLYPHSGLRDDALWQAAGLLRTHGDPRGAIDRLQQILDTRRIALIVGSYNAMYLDDAQLLAGRIWLDDLHDPARAAKAFATLADQYKDSTLRDDALFELSRARLAMHEPCAADDVAAACAALARILVGFPDGNRARAAATRSEELHCPAPPAKR